MAITVDRLVFTTRNLSIATRVLTFSPSKTVYMIILKRNKENHTKKPKFQFQEMTPDNRLNWEEHINQLRAKAKRKVIVSKK